MHPVNMVSLPLKNKANGSQIYLCSFGWSLQAGVIETSCRSSGEVLGRWELYGIGYHVHVLRYTYPCCSFLSVSNWMPICWWNGWWTQRHTTDFTNYHKTTFSKATKREQNSTLVRVSQDALDKFQKRHLKAQRNRSTKRIKKKKLWLCNPNNAWVDLRWGASSPHTDKCARRSIGRRRQIDTFLKPELLLFFRFCFRVSRSFNPADLL